MGVVRYTSSSAKEMYIIYCIVCLIVSPLFRTFGPFSHILMLGTFATLIYLKSLAFTINHIRQALAQSDEAQIEPHQPSLATFPGRGVVGRIV